MSPSLELPREQLVSVSRWAASVEQLSASFKGKSAVVNALSPLYLDLSCRYGTQTLKKKHISPTCRQNTAQCTVLMAFYCYRMMQDVRWDVNQIVTLESQFQKFGKLIHSFSSWGFISYLPAPAYNIDCCSKHHKPSEDSVWIFCTYVFL